MLAISDPFVFTIEEGVSVVEAPIEVLCVPKLDVVVEINALLVDADVVEGAFDVVRGCPVVVAVCVVDCVEVSVVEIVDVGEDRVVDVAGLGEVVCEDVDSAVVEDRVVVSARVVDVVGG